MPSTPAMTTWVGPHPGRASERGRGEHVRHPVDDGGWTRGKGRGRPLPPTARKKAFARNLRTGTMDFMTSSGRMTPMDAMPTPDLAVPYAAPKPVGWKGGGVGGGVSASFDRRACTFALHPIAPPKQKERTAEHQGRRRAQKAEEGADLCVWVDEERVRMCRRECVFFFFVAASMEGARQCSRASGTRARACGRTDPRMCGTDLVAGPGGADGGCHGALPCSFFLGDGVGEKGATAMGCKTCARFLAFTPHIFVPFLHGG